jgi:hypothetical protein
MQLIITVLVMVIYAALISLRAGRAMEEQAAIRPLLAGWRRSHHHGRLCME